MARAEFLDTVPSAERYRLLQSSCEVCGRPYMGAVFQTRCDRNECGRRKSVPREDLKGSAFGTLTVTQVARVTEYDEYWRCRCSCGTVVVKALRYLRENKRPICDLKSRRHASTESKQL